MSVRRFADAAQRLLQVARERVRAGDTSERRLARLAGLSQPHVHNVLTGKRALMPEVADRFLGVLGLDLEDLLSAGARSPGDTAAPWLAGPIGGGRAFPGVSPQPPARFFDTDRIGRLAEPFLARVADRETAMQPTLLPGDDLLLECSPRVRRTPKPSAVYAIEWRGVGYLCRCRRAPGALLTAVESDSPFAAPARIPLEGRRIADIVRGEVVWFGRDLGSF